MWPGGSLNAQLFSLIHSTDPQSRLVVIIVLTHVVRTYIKL